MKFFVTKCYIYNRKISKLLAIKRSMDDARGGEWENPGGGTKRFELPLECVKREVMEETGLIIKNPEFLYDIELPNTNIVFKNYIAYTDREDIMLSREHTEYLWLNVNDYLNIVNDEIKNDFIKHRVIYKLS